MFSKVITNSARFLKMPVDSQSLYFHLGLSADDDGVVEAWSVLRSTGSAEDNLRVLASKGFIKVLNEDLVSYIMDWNEHNAMRSDRLTPSAYRELLVRIIPDVQLVVPRQRADREKRLGRPRDNHGAPQDRIGEDRIGEVRLDKDINPSSTVTERGYAPDFEQFWEKYPKKVGKGEAAKAWTKLRPSKELLATILASVEAHKRDRQWTRDNGRFIPNPSTFINQRRFEDEVTEASAGIIKI